MVNKSNDEIIETLKKHKALTASELSKELGYSNLNDRLKRLAKKGLIQYKILPKTGRKFRFFRGYIGVALYYIGSEHLKEWIEMKLPPKMTILMGRIVARYMYQNFRIRRD